MVVELLDARLGRLDRLALGQQKIAREAGLHTDEVARLAQTVDRFCEDQLALAHAGCSASLASSA